ncbi:hypothetical protein, partial [Burkholderia cenocepacia]
CDQGEANGGTMQFSTCNEIEAGPPAFDPAACERRECRPRHRQAADSMFRLPRIAFMMRT